MYNEIIAELVRAIEWRESRREMAIDCADDATLHELREAETEIMQLIFRLMLDLEIIQSELK